MYIVVLYKILDWYCDAWILTDRGMIDVRWSLFMRNMTFTEFYDISGIESSQNTLFDKIFDIGDVTVHKIGWRNFYRSYVSTRCNRRSNTVKSHEHHHHDEHAAPKEQAMHIYLDGVRQ
jgi:hypothetical protein